MRLVVAVFALLAVAAHAIGQGTVYYNNGTYVFRPVIDKSGAAWATFADTLNTTGWGVLNVVTSSKFDDAVQAYAAGFVEGVLTQQRIYEQSLNMNYEFFRGQAPNPKLAPWLTAQDQWTVAQIAANPADPFWQQINLIRQQFEGLVVGYQSVAPSPQALQKFDFQVLNGVGDLLDLMNALQSPSERPDYRHMTPEQFEQHVYRRSLCSGLIRVTPDLGELFAAHSAWFTYSAMNRIYKHYNLNFNAPFVAAKTMSFSSYPGFLESLDDFYIMDSGLTMVQTTNSVFNNSLYDLVVPQSLLAWHRVRAANSMAHSGPEWFQIVSKYNSGTYNNQYMVVDYNLFQPGQPLADNTLWVVEQIPGLMVGDDLTPQLERGYFPSYNVPYFKQIYDLSGYPGIVKQYGPDYSYDLAPRAKIFRRDQNTVVDIDSLKHIMRYNEYKTDPFSEGNPDNSICSRGDLRSTPSLGGCYDSKVTNSVLAAKLQSSAINGPTYQDQPTFVWQPKWNNVAHFGQPTTFNFPFIDMQPQLP